MNELQETIIKPAIPPSIIRNNAAYVSFVIDRNDLPGSPYLEFIGVVGATDIAMAVLKVVESDTKQSTTVLGGTPTDVLDVVNKPGAGDTDLSFVVDVDLRKQRKRYLQLQATAGSGTAGTYLAAVAIAYRPQNASSGAVDRGGLVTAEYV